MAVKVILDTNNSTKTLAYLLIIFFLPFIGIIIYFTFGMNYRKNKLYKNKFRENQALLKRMRDWVVSETNENQDAYAATIGSKQDFVTLLLQDAFSPLSNDNTVELLINGEQKFPVVLEELEKAEKYIHIEYYIYDDDEIGNRIKDLLIKKAKAGVSVRLMYDDYGSHAIKKRIVKQLRDGGVNALPFYEIKFFFLANRYNYRDHRKTIIVDGKVGFLGGINISDKYINDKPKPLYWRDTHLKVSGEAVYSLQYLFMSNWNFCCGKELELAKELFPPVTGQKKQLVQIVGSGPDSDRSSIMLSFFTAIATAQKEVFITTPYFIPNESILDAIKKAALSGVAVHLLVPGTSDVKFVNFASRAYYGELLSVGVRIFLYRKGFIHAKTIAVDDNLSIVGTANMDLRSFDLNFEAVAVIYDKGINEQLKASFYNDLKDSEEIIAEEWLKRSKWIHLAEATAKLVSPIL
ncbi:MAG TPA: cardiolipin synthase [Chitinophagales bacterium]|nr:cardiolipin synthase [Chitinophagales bacterium]